MASGKLYQESSYNLLTLNNTYICQYRGKTYEISRFLAKILSVPISAKAPKSPRRPCKFGPYVMSVVRYLVGGPKYSG